MEQQSGSTAELRAGSVCDIFQDPHPQSFDGSKLRGTPKTQQRGLWPKLGLQEYALQRPGVGWRGDGHCSLVIILVNVRRYLRGRSPDLRDPLSIHLSFQPPGVGSCFQLVEPDFLT